MWWRKEAAPSRFSFSMKQAKVSNIVIKCHDIFHCDTLQAAAEIVLDFLIREIQYLADIFSDRAKGRGECVNAD